MRVAVVRNHAHTGVINRFGHSQPKEYVGVDGMVVESIVATLQESGHETLLCQSDRGLLTTLEQFMPPDRQARPSGMVFNMAYGIQGERPYSQVPAMLEMAGVPYTGPGPLGHGLALDKVIAKKVMRERGVPTPNFRVMRFGTENPGDLRYPVVVKPHHEAISLGLQLVQQPTRLKQAVEVIVTQYAQDALVEEYIEGWEICVALLGNENFEMLPLVEQDFGNREHALSPGRQEARRRRGAAEDLPGANRE